MNRELGLLLAHGLAQRLVVALETFDGLRQALGKHRQYPAGGGENLAPFADPAEGAAAAYELDAGPALEFLPPRDRNHAHHAGSGHMGASAGGEVEAVHFDESQRALATGLFAQRQGGRFLGRGETQADLTVCPDNAVDLVFGRGDLGRRHHAVQVDGGIRDAQVKALGARMADRLERGGEQMLSGMLLHVIEPPSPVDHASDVRARFERPVENVHKPRFLTVDHVQHHAAAQDAQVVRLPAPRGVESGGGEGHLKPAIHRRAGDDLGVELPQV